MDTSTEISNFNSKNKGDSETQVYSSWNLKTRDLPLRSLLFSFPPINVGTCDVESLLSYLSRMAFEYLVSPLSLLKYVSIRTTIPNERIKSLQLSRNINGMEGRIKILVDAFKELTQRNDIYFTTLLGWNNKICSRNLLRINRAWCPICFAEQKSNFGTNYEKLAWTLQPVKNCYEHQIPLEDKCPNCTKSLSTRSSCQRPGYCSYCFKWLSKKKYLGSIGHNSIVQNEVMKTEFEEMLTQPNLLKTALGKNRFKQNLTNCICTLAHGSIVEFSHMVSICNYKIRELIEGKILPTWNFLINISSTLEIPVLDLLTAPKLELSNKKILFERSYQFLYITC